MGYFVVLIVGIFIGRFFLTKELGLKVRNKIKGKSIKKNSDEQRFEMCPMCNGNGDLIDRTEQRYIKCPQCNGTGTIVKEK